MRWWLGLAAGPLRRPGRLPPPLAAPCRPLPPQAAHHPTSQVKALCKRKIKAGNEFVEQDMSTQQAVDGRDALSKAIYSRLFDRLITQIDQALQMGMEA